MDDDVRAIGEVTDIHGAPLTIGVYRGHVNLDGRMLSQEQMEQLAQLLVRATWEAGAAWEAARLARAAELIGQLERITTAWTRGMYSAWIDCRRGDAKAAAECLSEGLDGYDGPEWNGTETGSEWWERTDAACRAAEAGESTP